MTTSHLRSCCGLASVLALLSVVSACGENNQSPRPDGGGTGGADAAVDKGAGGVDAAADKSTGGSDGGAGGTDAAADQGAGGSGGAGGKTDAGTDKGVGGNDGGAGGADAATDKGAGGVGGSGGTDAAVDRGQGGLDGGFDAGFDGGMGGAIADGGVIGPTVGTVELYGTFHAMGVIATLPAGSDADRDATANVEYRVAGSSGYSAGFPLTRVNATTFVGSLFWLTPGTSYDVRVRYSDPDGAPVDTGCASATGATRDEIVIPSPLRTLNVSPTGSGTACTTVAPCALSQALGQLKAGDEVLLATGTYSIGELPISRSGTRAAPIVIRGAPGAILDGADPATFTWTSQGGGVFSTTVNRSNPTLATANGARLYRYRDLASLTALSASGTAGMFANGTTLSVHLAGGADPAGANMRVSRFNSALSITGSFVYLVGLTFQNYGQGDYPKAVYLWGSSDNLVQGCRFIHNDLSIGLKGAAHRNVIQDNEFSDSLFSWTWEDVKEDGLLEMGALRFYSPGDGRGTVIRRNKFHDYFDGLGICPTDAASVTNETDFYDNESYDNGDDGVETDGRCANVRLWNNKIHNTLGGISLAPVSGGPVYCLRNQIYMIGAGYSQDGYTGLPFKFNSSDGDSGAIYLLHNTVDAQRADNNGFAIMSPGSWQMLYSRNNVWAGTRHALQNDNTSQPFDMDYDDLWRSGTSSLVYWNTNYSTLAPFVTATGQESHAISTAPAFTAPSTGDFTPGASSPLIDRGVYLPGINDGYAGQAPDIGAVERR